MEWRWPAVIALVAVIVALILLYKLGSLAPRLSPDETSTVAASAHWHLLLSNPQYLPIKLLERLVAYIPERLGHRILLARVPSVLLGSLSAGLMLYILHRWYGRRTMIFGFVMFICAAWFLHVSRFAGFEVGYLAAIVSLIAAHVALYGNDEDPAIAYVWLFANILCLCIPGLVWFVAAGALLQLPELANAWYYASWWLRGSWVAITIAGLAIPAFSIVRSPALWRSWVGLPAQFGPWQDVLHRLADTVLAFVWHGPHNPQIWLGQLPLLDAFVLSMFIAGIVFYALHWRAARARLLLVYLVLGIVLAALGGIVGLSAVIPVIYLVAAAGMAYVLHFWLKRFPRNMFARFFGIALLAGVLGLSCVYNVTQYFVAWPHNPEVSAIYAAHR